MTVGFVLALFTSVTLYAQCDEIEISTKQVKRSSEVVFQGTVEAFSGTGVDRTVVFRVSRVWKGRVGRTFEMLAIETSGGICNAFWKGMLVIGNKLVVYASHFPSPDSSEYFPMRSKTTLVSRAKDLGQLGPGHKPK